MDCETMRQAAMALADGEAASLNLEQVQSHLAKCHECRCAVAELRSLNRLLDAQSRHGPAVDLWPRIRGQLTAPPAKAGSFSSAVMLATLVTILLFVRALVLTATQPLEWVVRLAALFFVLGWFFLLQENPFAIHQHLSETKNSRP